MSVIQKIRDKYATVMIIAVCVSLVAFLLMDAFVGPKSFFHRSTEVGEINGQGIEYRDFATQLQNRESAYRANTQNGAIDEMTRHQLQDEVWNTYVSNILLGEEFDKLGIGFSDDEMKNLTVTPDADPQIKSIPVFADPKTGAFDPNRVIEFLNQLSTMPANSQERQQWLQLEDYLRNTSLRRKFSSLVKEGIFVPKWLQEEYAKERNQYVDVSYVGVPYTTIGDSSVKVSDDELRAYLNAHSALFHQEEARRIEYVSFDAIPTAKDSSVVMKEVQDLKATFDTIGADQVEAFINRNSETQYYNQFLPEAMLQVPEKDSILRLPTGVVYGPYFSNNMVVMAKVMAKTMMPDSVVVRHILISTQATPDSIAKQRIDSIENAIRNGADFATMVQQFSDDNGSKQTGGEYTITPATNFVPEFKDYAFEHKKGDMGVVKSEYGYHLIQILDQKNIGPAYKIAYLTKRMDPSQETDNTVFSEANEFAGKNRTKADFDKSAQQQGLNKRLAENIQSSDYQIQGIGEARDLVRWAYDAKPGDVSNVFSLDNHYVVAVLTGIQKEGTAQLSDVRPQVEAAVRQNKKAAQIAQKMKGATLDAVAQSAGQPAAQAQHLNFMTPFIPNSGFEPKVVGAAFDKQLGKGKLSAPVYGNNGVYVLQVDSLTTETTAASDNATQQTEASMQNAVLGQMLDMLKKEGDVKDYRLKFF